MLPQLVRRAGAASQIRPNDLEPDSNAFRLSYFSWEMDTDLGSVFSSL